MEQLPNALDIVLQTHAESKEKIVMLKDIVYKFSQDNIFDNTFEIVKFCYFHIPVHFKYEEVLIKLLKNRLHKGSVDDNFILEILNEHDAMRKKFNRLKELADKMQTKNKIVKEEFVELVNDLCEEITAHAEKEDVTLYPMAKDKLTQSDLAELKKTFQNNSFKGINEN